MRRGLRLPGFNRQTALSFFVGTPPGDKLAPTLECIPTEGMRSPVEASLLAKSPDQATLNLRPNTVVQRSDKITPPKVNNPPTR
jgi:hypothetical protein